MNDQNKLYLELGANDKLTPIIEKILKDSEKLQQNFDNFKKITIKDIALRADGALTAIKKQIQDSLNAEPFTINIAPDIDTNRVTEAARAIIEAQEKIVNAASKGVTMEAEAKVNTTTTDTTGASTANTQAARENAEAVQQQAKSYEELRAQVDAVLGSLAKNTATIVEEKNALRLIDQEMKVINKDVEKQGSMTENQRKRLEQLTAAREKHKQTLQNSTQSLRNDIKLAQAADGSMNELSQSLGRMRMAYRAMSEEQRNSDFGKELLASIQKADSKIKELDATIGNHQRNVGNYLGRSYNGLNMSLQQIIRELPNASMGFGMFTLAISNNIPILADQIKMAKEAAKAQREMGQETTPVWKQLMKSFFSWQTALIVGVTLLTVYGKEIGEWAKQLLTGHRAAISAADATEKLNEALEKSDGKFSDNAMSIKKLASEWKELKSEAEKTAWIEANQSAFEQMGLSIRDVTAAERAFVEYTPAVIEALKSRARAEAARELAKEKYKEAFLKREKAKNEEKKGISFTDRMAGSMAQISTTGTGNFSANQRGASANDVAKGRFEQRVKNLNDEADTLEKEIDIYYNIAQLEDEKAKAELKRLGILKQQGKTAKEQLQAQKANFQAQLDVLSEAEAAGAKGEELRKKISDLDKRLSAYSNTKSDKADKEAARAAAAAKREAEKQGEAAEKRAMILTRQSVQVQRAAIDTELNIRQAEIGAMEDSTEKVLLQIKLDEEKKMEAIRREYEDLKIKRIEEAKKLWDADPKNKGVNFYESEAYKKASDDSQYTFKEQALKVASEKRVQAETTRALEKANQERLQIMYDYLKQYGTIQQRRYAIEKEYNDKILKATDENQKKILEKQKQEAVARTNAETMAMNIDWGTAFSNVGTVLKDIAKETLKEVEAYMQTAEFKALTPESKKTYTDLQKKLRQEGAAGSVSPFNFKIWGKIDEQVKDYQKAVERLKSAQNEHTAAVEALKKAEKQLAEATDDASKEIAKKAVENSKKQVEETANRQQAAQEETDKSKQALTDSTNAAAQGLQNFASYINEMADGSLYGFANGISKLITSLMKGSDGVGKALGELGGEIGGLIGAILQILDALGDDPTKFIDDLLDHVISAIDGILSQIQTGELVRTLVSDIVNLITTLLTNSWEAAYNSVANPFAFWGVGDYDRIFAGNSEQMEKEIEELSKSNERLAEAIKSLSERISDSDATSEESEKAFREAYKAEKEWQKNQREAIDKRASEWTNTGYGFLKLGGKSSFNANAPGATWEGWKTFNRILQQYGYSSRVSSAGSFWHLTPEEMRLLKDFAPTEWRQLFDTDGHHSPEDIVNEYIERAGNLDELTNALNEKLTGYDWGSFKSSFVDTLKDLTSTTEDFADNIEDLLTNAILNSLVNETYKDRIRALYQMIADAASDESEGGSSFTAGELQGIREANESLAEDLINARNALVESGVLKEKSDSGSRNTIMGATITENTASLLSGYINAIRADTSVNREALTQIAQAMQLQREMPETCKAQLQQLEQIARNTYATAQNTAMIKDIYDQFRKVCIGSDSIKIR